jgi:hypothetical protein
MTSKGGGTVSKFVNSNDFPFKSQFQGLKPGSPEFTAKWKQVASANPAAFKAAEHRSPHSPLSPSQSVSHLPSFIQKTHYDPLASKIKSSTGLDMSKQSSALQNVVWSTSVQHGGGTNVVNKAFDSMKAAGKYNPSSPSFQADAIKAIYAERGRTDGNGNLVHFGGNSKSVQQGVANRFKSEQADALRMLQ